MKTEITVIIIASVILFVVLSAVLIRLAIKRYSEKKLESYQNDLLKKHYNEVEKQYGFDFMPCFNENLLVLNCPAPKAQEFRINFCF